MSNFLIKELYPIVEKGLSKKENVNYLKTNIERFLDRNANNLSAVGPLNQIFFTEEDRNIVFRAIEADKKVITDILKKSKEIKTHWKIMNDPFNSAIILATRFFKVKKNEDMTKLCLIYFTLSMYPTLFKKYFKYGTNENVMVYTINNLNNKYKIKQTGTIYRALIETTFKADETNGDRLIRGQDKDIVDYTQDKKTRLNSLFKNISIEFYKNNSEKKYMNVEIDNYDEENYRESDNNLFVIERITNDILLKLVVDGPNMKIVQLSAKFCKVSVNELRNYTTKLINNEHRNDIKKVLESILYLYLYESQQPVDSINSNNFLIYCSEVYKKSNTNDKNIIEIKSILDKWLDEAGLYKKTQRLATISDFRRALYIFFVMTIEYNV